MMTIQHYYNIPYSQMISGDLFSNHVNVLPSLDAEDVLQIARVAAYVQRLDKQVEWLRAGVTMCSSEGSSSMMCDRVVAELSRVEQAHDQVLTSHGLGHVTTDTPDGLPQVPVFTFPAPIHGDTGSEQYQRSLAVYDRERRRVRPGSNIKTLEQPTVKTFLSPTFHRMWYYGHNTTRDLCYSGVNILYHRTHCRMIHYRDSYLRLGPFKYEQLSEDPHVGMFRDFFSSKECDEVVQRSRGKIKSTSYEARGKTKYYTTQRVSKRVHYTEDQLNVAKTSSDRISLATNWIVHQERHASDEYNVINYGLGGQIEVHVDYWNTDNKRAGGARIATFLGYLTDVEEGGRTVFPGQGLAVTPQKGSALFWLTVDMGEDYDSRMYHMGCPVARGNKWVLTKWIYSDSQMWTQSCERQRANYPGFRN